jgi:hypothetical protein
MRPTQAAGGSVSGGLQGHVAEAGVWLRRTVACEPLHASLRCVGEVWRSQQCGGKCKLSMSTIGFECCLPACKPGWITPQSTSVKHGPAMIDWLNETASACSTMGL